MGRSKEAIQRSFLALVFLFCAGVSICNAAIIVVAEPGAKAADVRSVQKAVDSFEKIVTQDMKFPLMRDIAVYVCPSRKNYSLVLEERLGMPGDLARRVASVTDGVSGLATDAVALLFDPGKAADSGYVAYHLTGHELMHHLQFQLAGERYIGTFFWLREGSAGIVGALAAEKNGFQSLDKWKQDRLAILRNAQNRVAAAEIMHPTLEQWTGFIEANKHPYVVADLMAFYLASVCPGNVYEGIAEYFELAAYNDDEAAIFQQSFGVTLNDFSKGFHLWLTQSLAAKGK